MEFFYSELGRVETALFLSDRAISTAALRRLQEERVQCTDWPNPGTFSAPQLAKNIFTQAYALGFRGLEWPQMLGQGETLAMLLSAPFPFRSPREAWRHYRKLDNIHKFGIRDSDWPRLVQSLEENSEAEIKTVTQALINVAHLYATSKSQTPCKFLTPWQWIDFAVTALETHASQLNWGLILQRPPHIENSDLSLWVPPHKELYPLEEKLLGKLEAHLKIQREPVPDQASPDFSKFKERLATENDHVFWAWKTEKAGPLESLAFSPQLKKLDLEAPNPIKNLSLLRALGLYLDYHEKGMAPLHRIKRLEREQKLLKEENIDYKVLPDAAAVSTLLQKHYSENFIKLEGVLDLLDFSSRETLVLLMEMGIFFEKSASADKILPHIHPRGTSFLTLEDLPILCSENTLLWGNPESLEEHCADDSPLTLSKQVFLPEMVEALQAESYLVPDPQREARLLRNFIALSQSKISFLSLPPEAKAQQSKAAEVRSADIEIERLSPTGLESYDACPLMFYFDRILKLRDDTNPNDPELKATTFGTWVHETLEDFIKAPPEKQNHEKLFSLCRDKATKLFEDLGNIEFQELLTRSALPLSEKLYAHFLNFEKPLAQVFPPQKRLFEESIRSQLHDWPLVGKVDRMDIGNGEMLLFDYKTGNYSNKALTLVENSKFQWFLYKDFLEAQRPEKVLGGGYLNPLDPKKSRLFLFEEDREKHQALFQFFETSLHAVDIINAKTKEALEEKLGEKLSSIIEGLSQKSFPAKPKKEATCTFCNHRSICGRPFFKQELK